MKKHLGYAASCACGLSVLLAACGGDDSSGPSSGSSGSPSSSSPTSTLSADQTTYESFALAPNLSFRTSIDLPASGVPATGTNYFIAGSSSLAASPSTGTQKTTMSAPASIASTLAITTASTAPTRYLVAGKIVVDSGPQFITNISYQGSGVRADTLATDGVTIVQSTLRSNFSNVPLTGTVAGAPTDLAQWFNALYYNPKLLNGTATWSSGAAYLKYTETEIGDVYQVTDNKTLTTGTSPDPTATGTTIAALMAAGGIQSSSDQTTYTLSNGAMTQVGGITTYVANALRPNRTTPMYHTYYEINGNVYTGNLIKDGTVIGGSAYPVAAPGTTNGYTVNYTQNFQVRVNAAAIDSLKAAVTF
ncbi:hypothetical protein [Burkholderia sp. LMG 32019]|uniref:hypothetical protein n=1 Tax=Burkholderia sp. LMG 32019 TaxID=3158173 RepID=UPI003C2F2E0E